MTLQRLCRKTRQALGALTQNDAAQARALHGVVRLFAAMLVITLVARAAAGAALPTVTLTSARQDTLVHTAQTTGTLFAADGTPFTVPEGLLVEAVYAAQGESIQQGAPLARFFADAVAQALQEAKAHRAQLVQQIARLRKGETADPYGVGEAQALLDEAYAAQEKTGHAGQASIASANEKRATAQKALDEVLAAIPIDPDAEAAARAALQQADDGVAAAHSAANSANDMALQVAQAAERARNSALHTYETAAAAAADQTAQSKADAGVLAVNLTQQDALLATLTALVQADCTFTAPTGGMLSQLSLTAGTLSPAVGGAITNDAAGFVLSFSLTKEQAKTAAVGMPIALQQGENKAQLALGALSAAAADGSITATVSNITDGTWNSGAANVSVELLREKHAMTLPSTAVHQDMAGNFVYSVETRGTVLGEQMVLVRTPVTVTARTPERVAVTGAITPQLQLVNTTNKPLQNSARVRVKQ